MVILAPLSVAALIVASWLAGGWRTARLEGAEDARARLAADEPGFAVSRVLVAADGRAALLAGEPDGAGVGAVIALGDKLVTRRFGPGEVLAVHLDDELDDGTAGPRLRIVTSDPTCRRVALCLGAGADSEAEADATESDADMSFWMTLLRQLGPGHAPGAPVAQAVAPTPSRREE